MNRTSVRLRIVNVLGMLVLILLTNGRYTIDHAESADPLSRWKSLGPEAPTVLRLIPHRGRDGTFFAFTPFKVYRTVDAGLHWSAMQLPNIIDITVHYPTATVYDLELPVFVCFYCSKRRLRKVFSCSKFGKLRPQKGVGGIPPFLYATSFGYSGAREFFKSEDGEKAWISASHELPDKNTGIYSIHANRSGVYLATDHGVLANSQ